MGEGDGMRFRVASVAFALLASACAQQDAAYLREGVGTELYAQSLVSATQLQEVYIGYICQQALTAQCGRLAH